MKIRGLKGTVTLSDGQDVPFQISQYGYVQWAAPHAALVRNSDVLTAITEGLADGGIEVDPDAEED